MKVKWSGLIDDFKGHIDSRHYARHIPGNSEEAAVCLKPELSKKTKKKKAEHPTAKAFAELMAETKAIMHDPERKVEWKDTEISKNRYIERSKPGKEQIKNNKQ
jgi:phosphopantetheinyl transferase (holo-ACP synthase)